MKNGSGGGSTLQYNRTHGHYSDLLMVLATLLPTGAYFEAVHYIMYRYVTSKSAEAQGGVYYTLCTTQSCAYSLLYKHIN